MKRNIHIAVGLILCLSTFNFKAYGAVKPTDGEAEVLPEIWQKVGPQERLKAIRVAEVDASRLLLERIMSLSINSQTQVRDLMLETDSIRGQITGSIKGVATTEAPEFLPDGRVQVVRAVKIRQIYEIVTRVIKEQNREDGSSIKLADTVSVDESKRDLVIDAMGNSALPNSDGLKKIKAKRAAEVDAYRRLAERIMGVSISSDSTVHDLALKSDKVVAAVATALKNAETTGIKYKPDLSCEVTMRIKEGDVIRTVIRSVNGVQQGLPQDSIDSKSFTETGVGAPQNDQAVSTGGENDAGNISETKEIVQKLVQQGTSN